MNEEKFTSGRGGARRGAGRPIVPEDKKAKNRTFKLYDWEVEKVRQFIKTIRNNQISIFED